MKILILMQYFSPSSEMKRQYGDKVEFEFTIHFHYRQSELTKKTIETAAEKLFLVRLTNQLVTRPFPDASNQQPREGMWTGYSVVR